MDQNKKKQQRRLRRKRHIRARTTGSGEKPRLTVFRSNKHIYGQLVDDERGVTLASASSVAKDVRSKIEGSSGGRKAAEVVGGVLAERAKAAGISQVVFDRNGYKFHGRIKVLAEAARKAGLKL